MRLPPLRWILPRLARWGLMRSAATGPTAIGQDTSATGAQGSPVAQGELNLAQPPPGQKEHNQASDAWENLKFEI